ncbi:MAG: hypothetical protein EA350_00615 [Gemmatimonadales bacterium]|nr:MAG: hypothetical protein EA350_00615 [Gemmatimonadales bacterium]
MEETHGEIIVGVVSGLVVLIVTALLVFLHRRLTLDAALLACLRIRMGKLLEMREFLVELRDHQVEAGKPADFTAHVTPTGPGFFEDVRGDLYKYYLPSDFTRLIHFFHSFDEAEILIQGLCDDLAVVVARRSQPSGSPLPLSSDEATHLHARIDRAVGVIDSLRIDPLKKIGDLRLPDSTGVPGPVAVMKAGAVGEDESRLDPHPGTSVAPAETAAPHSP